MLTLTLSYDLQRTALLDTARRTGTCSVAPGGLGAPLGVPRLELCRVLG